MKLNPLLLIAALFFSPVLFAQNQFSIFLRTGAVTPQPNLRQSFVDSFNARAPRVHNKAFVVLQFEKLPAEDERKELAANGIELLEYVSGNAYTATVNGNFKTTGLKKANLRSIIQLTPQQKMNSSFARGVIPAWAVKSAGTVDVWISYPKTFTVTEVVEQLKQSNIEVLSLANQAYRVLALRIAANRLAELAALPFIEYVQPAPPEDQPLNYNSRTASRASVLNASIANGGKGLNGEGVVVGIGDNSDIQTHIDFAGRLINRAAISVTGHGQHVSGTLAGAGTINELYRGYAPGATLVSQSFSGILSNAATYVKDYGMVITNNSYGDIIECDYHGTYDLISRYLDQMAFDYPSLQNVFAAGNSGTSVCPPFTSGYRTVLGSYQSAKNVITVGATNDTGLIASFSSRGPVKDGRTKPEITAMGQSVVSTYPTNTYGYGSGTSMAAPAVSGGLALLYQRYRQLNGGTNPKNALMKALLCNGAADRGNAGPDFQYGFGWMNLLRSVEMLEAKHYFMDKVSNGATNTHTITVPANTAQLKVLLYWNDPAASVISSKTLVNDLDLQVADPSLATHLPGILDTAAANAGNIATTGADHINNMEQVVVDHPAAGSYSFKIAGTAIAQNSSQDYVVVYDVLPVQLALTAPAGGVGLVPGEATKISWDAYGLTGTATLEFSTDNGASWTTIETGIGLNRTLYTWTVPNVATDKALIRLTKEGTGETTTTNTFTILQLPVVSLSATQCEGYINLNWTAASNATDYEVMRLQGDEMKTVATTTATSYTFSGLSKDSVYWVTVRPRINGKAGRRAIAISRQPNSGNCSGAISDNDLKADAIVSPKTGRKFTSTELGAAAGVSVRIKNLDDAPVSSFDVTYSVNGGGWVTEHVTTPLAAQGIYTHNFSTPVDFSAVGSYTLTVVVKNSIADPVAANDTLAAVIRQLDNQPLDLATYFVDDLENAAVNTYKKDTAGLEGADRYDFSGSTAYGRVRTFINSGIAYSGSKALTLDVDRYYSPGNTNYLYGTFNLGNYDTAANDVRLDFRFLNHSQTNNAVNEVWIRGNDTASWVEVYDLSLNQANPGLYKKTDGIELSDYLADAGQNFSSSFQVRWGQFGQLPATDRQFGAGYTFDDIRLYEVFNDVQLKSIDAPSPANCGLTNATAIQVSVQNHANVALANIPVRYRVNNGPWITETISSIAANSTVPYTFTTPYNFSAFGAYTVEAVVDLSSDSFRDNDTALLAVRNLPVIASFPYLQNFETGDGYWFTGGTRSSWEYGTPRSTKINRAASGTGAWKTRLQGGYNDNELSYLYSPCFNIASLVTPALSFSVALDIEDCGSTLCDAAWVEYSEDGTSWTKLGATNGTNWYNKTTDQVWSVQNYTRWHVATAPLPTGLTNVRFRFVLRSDPGVNREGIAIDDIHIYDNRRGIYDSATMTTPVVQTASGTNWVDFSSGGKLIASIQPNNQNLGATAVQAYIFKDSVRNNNNQYYHGRNITIKPSTSSLSDSVGVRFYFLDSETDSLINATGCSTCGKPASAYELGISQYSDPDTSFENGTIADDLQGLWHFVKPGELALVPFDKGYYAEFKVKDFSEFWLNTGGFDRSTPLPVKMMEFTVQRGTGSDVLLRWKVGSEASVLRYEIELARGNEQLQAARFTKIGAVAGGGNTTITRNYSFADTEADKFGPRYYRLKIVNVDGSFTYSPIRSVVFDEAVLWRVYPNPSNGNFYLVYQANSGEKIEAHVYDASGRLVSEVSTLANGFPQKLGIDVSKSSYASGMYLLQIKAGGTTQSFKLHKL